MSEQKYPLDWPVGYPRTDNPKRSSFKNPTLARSVKNIVDEVNRLQNGFTSRVQPEVVISSNIPLRNDGYPRADYMKSVLRDKGVAVYFEKDGQPVVLCCDQYDTIESNLHAIYKSIEALRAIDRWGVSDFLNRSFSGFKALPQSTITGRPWHVVLGFPEYSKPGSFAHAETNYKIMAKKLHPDVGGDHDLFTELQHAFEQCKKYFGMV
jgi:hypothetical protein